MSHSWGINSAEVRRGEWRIGEGGADKSSRLGGAWQHKMERQVAGTSSVSSAVTQKRKQADVAVEQLDAGHFRSTVEQMLEDGLYSDVTFESESDDRTPAHRCMLASGSPVFRAMFQNKMLEQATSVVKVEDMSTGAFRAFLRLLYTGSLSREDIQTFGLEVLAACHKYEVPQLAKICSPVLGDMLTIENALSILEHAVLYDEYLFERCKEFIGCNMKQLVSGPGFEDLAMRKPLLLIDVVRSINLDGKMKELRISFRGFSTARIRNCSLRMSAEGTVGEVIAELKLRMRLPSTRWLQISGIADHRIVRIYSPKDKVRDLLEDLKAEEIPAQKVRSTVRTLRLSHMLIDRSGKFLSYFGEPFTMRVPNDRFMLWQLKELILTYKVGLEFSNFHFAKRSTLDPEVPYPEYLDDNSPVPLHDDDFLALSSFHVWALIQWYKATQHPQMFRQGIEQAGRVKGHILVDFSTPCQEICTQLKLAWPVLGLLSYL